MTPPFTRLIAAALLSLTPSLVLQAADWPRFRGPNSNGVMEELSLPAVLKESWRIPLPGRGLSSPITVGERIFITCSSGARQDRLHIIGLDRRTGKLLWERQFRATGRTMCHEKTCVAAPSPASDGQYLFALFSSNDLVCLDLDGNLIWLRGLTLDYPNASNSLGMASSLTTAEGVVIAQVENDSESFTAGIDAKTGINRWKLDRPKLANWTSPVVWKNSAGFSCVLVQSGRGLTAIQPGTGELLWNYADGASTVASTTPSGPRLYVPSNGLTVLEPASTQGAPQPIWRSGQLRPSTPSPVVLTGRVFTVNDAGVLTCGSAESGARLWQLRLKGPFSATPVGAGFHLYLFNENGLGQVVDTSAPEGALLSEIDLGQTILSTPAIVDDGLLVRSDSYLWKLGKS